MCNTSDSADVAWIRTLPKQHPIHTVVQDWTPVSRPDMVRLIGEYHNRYGHDDRTAYVRLDHDIVFMTRGVVGNVGRASVLPGRQLTFPLCLNSRSMETISGVPFGSGECHRKFLAGEISPEKISSLPAIEVGSGGASWDFSANAMGWYGPRLPIVRDGIHEEAELTRNWSDRTQRPHVIDPGCGMVVHFSYHGQRGDLNGSPYLEGYRARCLEETGLEPSDHRQ